MSLTFEQVLLGLSTLAFLAVMLVLYRMIREIIPTLRQIRRTIREMELTIRNSQEILYNVKSITHNLDEEVQELHEVVAAARGIVGQVESVTSLVTKPVTGLRSVLAGLGYGMKYLFKRDGSGEEYEEEEA
jgi:uncharacterized protein YoxC